MGSVPRIKSMVNSTSLSEGKPEISSGNSLTMGMSSSRVPSYLISTTNAK